MTSPKGKASLNQESVQNPSTYETLRQMIDLTGVGVFETTIDGEYRYANLVLAQMLGYDSSEEFLKDRKTSTSFYADESSRGDFKSRIAETGNLSGFVSLCRRRDGSTFWISENATVIRDSTGQTIGYVGSIADVTELIEMQSMLADAEASYRRIFERVREGIFRTTLEGKALRTNPALDALNGYATEEEHLAAIGDIGQEWYVDPARREEFREILERDEIIENFESEVYRHKTRERIWVSENAYLVRSESGEPLFYEGTVQDITERKRAETALLEAITAAQKANSAKSRFLANMSHELRTPLNSIIGFTELMKLEAFGPVGAPEYKQYVSDISKSGRMLLQLISDILEIAKLDAGKVAFSQETVRPEEIIQDAITMLRNRAEASDLQLINACASNLPQLIGDNRRLRQVLINLMTNSIKFTAAGGTVRVSAEQEGSEIVFRISDTGVGIPKDELEKVFVPFEQSSIAPEKAKDGAGLGLPLTRELVNQHGGWIGIESTLDVGTTVTVRLPLPGTTAMQ